MAMSGLHRCAWLVFLVFIVQMVSVCGDDEERTPEELEEARRMRWGTPGYGAPRKPGKLLLNMLIKNERDHLDRTLPHWAKIIDYWIIGVDDNNTDDSMQIIHKHLSHIPGAAVMVHFDGMGPTWSILVQHGIDHFPEATHGIIADADFKPMSDKLDKMQLDIRCSKHMYTIWTEDHSNERRMDWIYQNIQGAKVKRRTHQAVEAPELPYQEVFQTLIDLKIEEKTGGYQDRTPGKNERYIQFLLDDLEDYPGDERTLYYLGYAHYDNFKKAWESNNGRITEYAQSELNKGMDYMRQRMAKKGNKEERWFTVLKMGEIHERYLQNWPLAEKYYKECTEDDPERADAWFYIGQHYRLTGQHREALKYLRIAAKLEVPERSLFQWHFLYHCLSKLELGRALAALAKPTLSEAREVLSVLKTAYCKDDPRNDQELQALKDSVGLTVDKLRGKKTKGRKRRVKVVRKLLKLINKNFDDLDEELSEILTDEKGKKGKTLTLFEVFLKYLGQLNAFYTKNRRGKKYLKPSCRQFRRATTPYLRFFKRYKEALTNALAGDSLMKKWLKANAKIRNMCR